MTQTVSPDEASSQHVLLVTGMSGAGKSTALHSFEDMGWDTVDNLPLRLFDRLVEASLADDGAECSLAIGIDSRTKGFDAAEIVTRIQAIEANRGHAAEILFLDCSDAELERRFSETRRRHPLALDQPVASGIALEREMLAPLRGRSEHLIDTTGISPHALKQELRDRFGGVSAASMTILITSFSYARGTPRNADLVFDMRFLRNPHWEGALRPATGLDDEVGIYIAQDPAYAEGLDRIVELLLFLLPRYQAQGRFYMTVAFGCTGGRHRSVRIAEKLAERLHAEGFSPTVAHRDLATLPRDTMEAVQAGAK